MDLKTFYKECVKRKVFKGISIYAISSWLIIQVTATTFPFLGFPNEAVTTVIILVLICFPVSIIFSWYYNVVPEPEEELDEGQKAEVKGYNRIFFLVMALIFAIVIIVAFMVSRKNFENPIVLGGSDYTHDQVAVLEFANNTSDASLDIIGKMVSDWISHGIIQHEVAPVLNYESINQLTSIGKIGVVEGNLTALANITSFSKLIKGAFYRDKDQLIFQSEIIDKLTGAQYGFPSVRCPADNPIEGIEKLKQQVLSYFQINKKEIPGNYLPLYDAYKEFINAKNHWIEDNDLALRYLNNALELDSSFYQAAYYKAVLHYNQLQYATADSLINLYSERYTGNDLPMELFGYLESMIDGKYQDGFRKYEGIFEHQPSDLFDNTAMLVLRYNFVNNLDNFKEIYNLINELEIDFSRCTYCNTRLSLMAYVEIEDGRPDVAEKLLLRNKDLQSEIRISEALIKAYIAQGKYDAVDNYCSTTSFKLLEPQRKAYLFYIAGRESALVNNSDQRDKYIKQSLNFYTELGNGLMMGRCNYLIENYDEAYTIFEEIYNDSETTSAYLLSRMIAIDFLNNRSARAEKLLEKLRSIKGPYDYGTTEYLMAHIDAKRGDENGVYQKLEESLLNGKYYGSMYFQNDPHLIAYHKKPQFKKLLTYWH